MAKWRPPSYCNSLLTTFSCLQGWDTLSIPLLDKDQRWETWKSQNMHIACIQNPDNVQLYVQTGTLTKGGIQIPMCHRIYIFGVISSAPEQVHTRLEWTCATSRRNVKTTLNNNSLLLFINLFRYKCQ